MAITIGFLNQKGGVGKTTLSINVAHELFMRGGKILLIDADPQQSALDWSVVRKTKPPFDVIGFSKKTLHRDLFSFSDGYDFAIIDGPPRVTELTRSCIMASDIVIIPCTPSPYDIWASMEILELLSEASIYKENLKTLFVVNRKIANTALARDTAFALDQLGIKVLKSSISQRVIFAESAAAGLTVYDLEPDGKGANEISELVDGIFEVCLLKKG